MENHQETVSSQNKFYDCWLGFHGNYLRPVVKKKVALAQWNIKQLVRRQKALTTVLVGNDGLLLKALGRKSNIFKLINLVLPGQILILQILSNLPGKTIYLENLRKSQTQKYLGKCYHLCTGIRKWCDFLSHLLIILALLRVSLVGQQQVQQIVGAVATQTEAAEWYTPILLLSSWPWIWEDVGLKLDRHRRHFLGGPPQQFYSRWQRQKPLTWVGNHISFYWWPLFFLITGNFIDHAIMLHKPTMSDFRSRPSRSLGDHNARQHSEYKQNTQIQKLSKTVIR